MTEPLEFALIARLRETLADQPPTEADLRTLREQAEGWQRALEGQMHGNERRLLRLDADPSSPLAEIAAELRHGDAVRSELAELRDFLAELDARTRELRTEWLARQAGIES